MDPRKILGVGDHATNDEIARAYREKSRKHHPDLGGDAWAFQQVQEAYEALTNSDSANPTSSTAPKKPRTNNRPNDRPTSQSNARPRGRSGQSTAKSRPRASARSKTEATPEHPEHWWHLFYRHLPLQNETTIFILVNVFDIFMTYILLRFGAIEANPIANYFFKLWNFAGMIAFKLVIVALVCVIAQIVALKKIQSARFLLIAGTVLTGAVVLYSVLLFQSQVK